MDKLGILMMIIAAFLAAVSQVLLKRSARKKYSNIFFEYLNPNVILGYGILLLTMGINMLAFRTVDYKYGPVINATSYVFVLILGKIILKEKITRRKLVGNFMIIVGILIYSFN